MNITEEIEAAGMKEIVKGLATITNAYLALRLTRIEGELASQASDHRKKINDMEFRLDRASKAFKSLEQRVAELEVKGENDE